MGADPVQVLELDLRADLERVEEALRQATSADHPLVQKAAGHLLQSGGKRFRPMLVLLSGRLGDHADQRLIACGAAIELTHQATLCHDDVIDEAAVRHGTATVNAHYDNTVAILTGDFLFARSSGIAADLGTYVSRRLADTIALLCEGQIMESESAGVLDSHVERYLEVIRRKTASLIATSCHLGAWLAGASQEEVEAVTAYGEALGMAFQLSDDLLDVVGYEEHSGKVTGTDLRQGVYTLPVLMTLAGEVAGGPELRAALAAREIEAALGILRSNGSVERARDTVDAWEQTARAAIAPIPAGPVREAMEQLAGFVASRTG